MNGRNPRALLNRLCPSSTILVWEIDVDQGKGASGASIEACCRSIVCGLDEPKCHGWNPLQELID
jgi:hypothetical protein